MSLPQAYHAVKGIHRIADIAHRQNGLKAVQTADAVVDALVAAHSRLFAPLGIGDVRSTHANEITHAVRQPSLSGLWILDV